MNILYVNSLEANNKELRQQLADARSTADYWKAEHFAGNKQLADSQKREVILRDALDIVSKCVTADDCRLIAVNALAATEPKP